MSKRYHQHQLRHQGLSQFGKELTRRSGACCELCATCNVSLSVFEVPPVPQEPDISRCVFICPVCQEQINKPKRRNPDHWYCLSKAIWSPEPAVQALAVHLLQEMNPPWAEEQLENLYLAPEIADWAAAIRFE